MHTSLSKCVLVLVCLIGMTTLSVAQRTTATLPEYRGSEQCGTARG